MCEWMGLILCGSRWVCVVVDGYECKWVGMCVSGWVCV